MRNQRSVADAGSMLRTKIGAASVPASTLRSGKASSSTSAPLSSRRTSRDSSAPDSAPARSRGRSHPKRSAAAWFANATRPPTSTTVIASATPAKTASRRCSARSRRVYSVALSIAIAARRASSLTSSRSSGR